MRIEEKDIMFELGDHWVLKVPSGPLKGFYEVLKNNLTHSVVVANIGYRDQIGLDKAIAECRRRESGLGDNHPSKRKLG